MWRLKHWKASGYLTLGQVPGRFQIQRLKLNFLQYILQQNPASLLHQMLIAKKEHPIRGIGYQKCPSQNKT